MKFTLGIDPGISGAAALYDQEYNKVEVIDLPVLTLTTNGKTKRKLDLTEFARWLDVNKVRIKNAIIEDVHATPQMGVTSAFGFGFTAGALQGIVAANFIAVELANPRVWKKAMKLTADKDSCRRRASQLFPTYAELWCRAKDDGRAEAALLAYYRTEYQ